MWNLIHNSTATISCFESDDGTLVNTNNALLQFGTLAEAQAAITSLGLTQPTSIDALPPNAVQQAQSTATARINAAYQSILDSGISAVGLVLAADDSDQQLLAYGLTILNAGLLVSAVQPTDMVSAIFGRQVADINGDMHDMTVSNYVSMALLYGATIGGLQANQASKLSAIDAAATVEIADGINW